MSVIGAMMLDNACIATVASLLRDTDFYSATHQQIFSCIVGLSIKNKPCDLITLCDDLKSIGKLDMVGGMSYIANLVDDIPSAANVKHYADIVKDMSLKREVIKAAYEVCAEGFGNPDDATVILDQAQAKFFNINAGVRTDKDFTGAKELLREGFKVIEDRVAAGDTVSGIPSGFIDLDNLTSGFQKADLVIIAARPAMGKTSIALNILENISAKKYTGAIFSLEMQKSALTLRMISSFTGIDSSRIRRGIIRDNEWPMLTWAAGELSQYPFYINDIFNVSPMDVRAKARRLKAEHGLDLLIIDYLQLMISTKKEVNQERELATITRELKGIAKDLDIPVILLSQLNRDLEKRNDKRPCMADLRGSGAIEQDADLILFIYRDEVYNEGTPDKGVAEIIIGKQRNGPIGKIRLAYRNECTKFENLALTHRVYNDN
jgi:replicative DNA helicase